LEQFRAAPRQNSLSVSQQEAIETLEKRGIKPQAETIISIEAINQSSLRDLLRR
jgi:sulfur relay (sulfurtransferase) DsrF/TusC family protein